MKQMMAIVGVFYCDTSLLVSYGKCSIDTVMSTTFNEYQQHDNKGKCGDSNPGQLGT